MRHVVTQLLTSEGKGIIVKVRVVQVINHIHIVLPTIS